MMAANKCRVDECDRNAASTIVRDSLPGPLPLCLTHTEDFRMNGAGWNIVWEHTSPEPTSVTTGAVARVGRSGPPAGEPLASSVDQAPRAKSLLSRWRKKAT